MGDMLNRDVREIKNRIDGIDKSVDLLLRANRKAITNDLMDFFGKSQDRVKVFLAVDGESTVNQIVNKLKPMKQPNVSTRISELFDEDFFMYGEDVWLSWHVMRLGYRLACATSTSIEHEGSASSKHGGLFYEYHSARVHVLLGLKMVRHPIEVPALIVGRIFYLLARALFRSVRFRSMNPLRAYLMAWFPIELRPR